MGSKDTKAKDAVTLQTIADRLNVSRTTVSNAFSRPDQMTAKLRDKILRTARELDYCGPDPAARTLRKGKSGSYGLVLTESLSYAVTDPAAVQMLRGVAEVFDEQNVSLLVIPLNGSRELGMQSVLDAVVDGFYLNSIGDDDPRLTSLLARRVPIVALDEPNIPDVAFVGLDERAAARSVGEHVLDLGHRVLTVLSFPLAEDDYRGLVDAERLAQAKFMTSRDRLAGFRDAVEARGLAWETVRVYEAPINSVEAGEEGAGVLLDGSTQPTALLALSDQLAIGAYRAAKARGLSIPRQLSITGFDDIPEAPELVPPLTTVRQPLLEKAVLAARILIDGWDGKPPRHILPTELVVRASTGPVPD